MAHKQIQANLMPPGSENRLATVEEYQQADLKTRRAIRDEYRRRGLKPPHGSTGKPNGTKGKPRPNARGPRPHVKGVKKPYLAGPKPHRWLTGPDPQRHDMYVPYLKSRAQANYRGELWDLTFEQWEAIWAGRFTQRGRSADSLCMIMDDPDRGWCVGNAMIVTRREQLQRMAFIRMQKQRGL